jgi:hypothetical protein
MKARLRLALLVLGLIAIVGQGLGQPAFAGHRALEGNRIFLLGDESVIRGYAASEPAFVLHGWALPIRDTAEETGWSNLSSAERREFRDDSVWRFELFIDGVAVPLERYFEGGMGGPSGDVPQISKLHGVQFAAGAFSPGTYTFTGVWYGDVDDDDVSDVELTRTVTVVFDP